MTALAQFDKALESLLSTKAPGVSGSKVQELTKLAVQNVKDNAQFITHLYKHFRLSPGTHKLGVLYVVDSIARMYQEQARRHGQDISTTTDDGTFAGGLRHITSVLPSLMNDIIQHAPDSQKDKIRKLLDIWQRSKTFPDNIIADYRQKMQENESSTPPGSPPPPPPPPITTDSAPSTAANPPDAASVLSALAAMAKAAPQQPPAPAQPPVSTGGSFANSNAPFSSADPRFRNVKSPPQPVATPSISAPVPSQTIPSTNPFAALTALLPQSAPQPAAQSVEAQKLAIIQLLLQQGVPIDQVAALINAQPQQPTLPPPQTYAQPQDVRRRHSPSRSPPYGRSRSRSVSPPRGRGRGRRHENFGSPPPREQLRRSPSYDDYRRRSPSRSRSPPRRRMSPPRERSPFRRVSMPEQEPEFKPRFIEYDETLKPDRIRVLSRTLFVGGVTSRISEDKLRALFSKFGGVQSIIMNHEKRCAFLKMYTRDGAIAAREGMEVYPTDDTTIRTKYGVGFGPRDCSDYTTGISIVPISRLTDADRKWIVTAEYGGTGGRPLEAGMTLEEPDIEIGAGVSSKAISQKIHLRGNQNQEGGRGGGGRGRGRGRGGDRDNQSWNQREDVSSPGGMGGGLPQGFPPFPMMPGQQGMFPGGPFPPGQFPPFMMPPQMQAFFQQQFGGQQGQQQQGQQGHEGYGFGDQQGEGGQ